MTKILAINDMAVQALEWRGSFLTVVSENDPMLRRFGQCDYVRMKAEETFEILRRQADEVWALIAGQADVRLEDRREESPSYQAVQTLEMDAELPKAVLVPFGVRCRIAARTEAVLIRLTTHEDSDIPEDHIPLQY